jgi:hypothetical protein
MMVRVPLKLKEQVVGKAMRSIPTVADSHLLVFPIRKLLSC